MYRGVRRGFSRIESLIVGGMVVGIVVLSVLNFGDAARKGRDVQRKSDIRELYGALRVYFDGYGDYPEAAGGRVVGCGNPGFTSQCDWGLGDFMDVDGTVYMRRVPGDPLAPRRQYLYVVGADRLSFRLYAALERSGDVEVVDGLGVKCGKVECNFVAGSPDAP